MDGSARVGFEVSDLELGAQFNLPGYPVPVWKLAATTPVIQSPIAFGDDVPGATRVHPFGPAADLIVGRAYVVYVAIGPTDAAAGRRDSVRFVAK